MDLKIQLKISEAMAEVYRISPIIYKVFGHFRMIEDRPPNFHTLPKQSPTMGVRFSDDGHAIDLIYNPEFVDKLPLAKLKGVLIHEALHVLMNHLNERAKVLPKDKDPDKFFVQNQAMDLAINQLIPEELLPDSALLPGKKPFETLPLKASFEEYFELIWKQFENNVQKLKDQLKNAFQDAHQWGNDPMEGDGQPMEASPELARALNELAKDLGLPGNEIKDGKDGKDAKDQKPGGKPPGTSKDWHELKQNIFPPPPLVDWKSWLKKVAAQRQNWEEEASRKNRNRRFGFNFPGMKKKFNKKHIAVAIDVSGSVPREMVTEFCREASGLLNYVSMDIIWFGYEVCKHEKNIKKRKSWDPPFGGGTSFHAPINWWNKYCQNSDHLYIFTDGEAESPKTPKNNGKITWVLPDRNYRIWGGDTSWCNRIIYMRDTKK